MTFYHIATINTYLMRLQIVDNTGFVLDTIKLDNYDLEDDSDLVQITDQILDIISQYDEDE